MEDLHLLAERLKIRFARDLSAFPYVQEKAGKIPYLFAKKRSCLPLERKGEKIVVAISDPFELESLEELSSLLGREIEEVLTTKESLEAAIETCYSQEKEETSGIVSQLKQEKKEEEEEGYDLLERDADSSLIRLLNSILLEAIQEGASDIHFEPMEQGLSIRYRIDGVLQKRHFPHKEFQSPLITRIKVMARLDIAEQRLPQDGRIKLRIGGRQIDFRVSSVPVVYGERIVLRILDKSNVLLGVNKLGMLPSVLDAFQKSISHSEGIVLVTGPTGSGKTTTLYSALSEINSSEMNIMTIEDPVEYKLQGMAQIGVNPKISLNFATGLRHILRQDPDVIMIGEIRDRETAEIAIQSSLTGHLVLSTLHTNDAPSALTRLVDMGIEPYLLSSSVIAILAQRLVRTICPLCKEEYEAAPRELLELGLEQKILFRGRGCSACLGSGFKGRHGIYEFMLMTGSIKKQLLLSADAVELQKAAVSSGMLSLRQDGARLVAKGLTTSSDVFRVTRELKE